MPIYSINGGGEIHGVNSSWRRIRKREAADGQTAFTPLALNTWRLPYIFADDYEALQSLRGTALTSLETNNIDDRNAAKTYSGSVICRSVEGEQVGHQVQGVEIVFEVEI